MQLDNATQFGKAPSLVGERARRVRVAIRVSAVLFWVAMAVLLLGRAAVASNPRWVSGPPYFTINYGTPLIWYTRTPLYFTDPGDLSQYVNHAAADAIVAAAAGAWNVGSADFTPSQGGNLAEHVTGQNSYLSSTGVVFPADVQASNYQNIQIAVIYDTDGSVTDLLMGQGASAPLECSSNAVTESVDSISTNNYIQHAVVVLNGRCTGPAPEQQLQLQYQLMRAFGRVFGIGWSQTNDNVFTQTPTPTIDQAMHWPVMHPIDIVCGRYTYQCMPQPFTLRDDDVAAISQLYVLGFTQEFGWTGFNQWLPGKHQTFDRAGSLNGTVSFPNGQGMDGVNVVIQRLYMFSPTPQAYYDVSSTTGFLHQRYAGNPVMGAPSGMQQSFGNPWSGMAGWFDIGWIPMIDDQQNWVDALITTEPVNPLYIGTHSVGPYTANTVTPSGTTAQQIVTGLIPNDPGFGELTASLTAVNGAATCNAGADGSETAPATTDPTGWWNDVLCGAGHNAWFNLAVALGHTATIEVTTYDETGAATENKMSPQIGIWNASDPTGTTPTYAYTQAPFNTVAAGTTALTIGGTTSGALRMVVTDSRGDGRPDYAYKARVLYAASISPATTGMNGNPFILTGTGFRPGNEVLINGVAATVSSWTANTITGVAPPASSFAVAPTGAVDVTVRDLQTGGTTTILGALTYSTQPGDVLTLVSAPSGTLPIGVPAATPFAVRVLLPDGVTPAAGVAVQFTYAGALTQLTGCTGSPCLAVTDATGLAAVTVTPVAAGDVTLTAASVGAIETAMFHAQSHTVSVPRSAVYVAAGSTVAWTPVATLLQDSSPVANTAVQWSGAAGLQFGQSATVSGGNGTTAVTATVGPLTAGATASGTACGWAALVMTRACTTLTALGVDPATLHPEIAGGAGQSISTSGSFNPVLLQIADPAGHPVGGATVMIHQTVDQEQMPCPGRGACPTPAQLSSSVTTAVSDINGAVTVTPLQVPGTTAITHIAATTGAQGFVSLSLTQN